MTHLAIIGGSDAGISAALRARELDPTTDVTVVVADEYPNFSICGIPYYFTGEVQPWQSLAHRTSADLEATGMTLRLNTFATGIDVAGQRLEVRNPDGSSEQIAYDELIVGTGALPSHAGISGLAQLGPTDGVHVIHSMGDTFALDHDLTTRQPASAIIVGAGYVGLEMAEAFTARGMQVTQLQRGPEVLSTLDPELGTLVHNELTAHGVDVITNTTVDGIEKTPTGLTVTGTRHGEPFAQTADLVLVVVGVRPNTELLERAGASLGAGRAVVVDERMRTGLPHVWAAGDGRDLVRLLPDLDLSQDQACPVGQCGDQVRRGGGPRARAAQGLAIDRDHPAPANQGGAGRGPHTEDLVQDVAVDSGEQPPERGLLGRCVQPEPGQDLGPGITGPLPDRGEALRPGHHRRHRDREQSRDRVADPTSLARVPDPAEQRHQMLVSRDGRGMQGRYRRRWHRGRAPRDRWTA